MAGVVEDTIVVVVVDEIKTHIGYHVTVIRIMLCILVI